MIYIRVYNFMEEESYCIKCRNIISEASRVIEVVKVNKERLATGKYHWDCFFDTLYKLKFNVQIRFIRNSSPSYKSF